MVEQGLKSAGKQARKEEREEEKKRGRGERKRDYRNWLIQL